MTLDPAVRADVDDALRRIDSGKIDTAEPVAGGCISDARRVRTTSGAEFFLKASSTLPAGIFAAEAASLRALADARAVRVPAIVACSDEVEAPVRWLLLEWLEPAPAGPRGWSELGSALATLHRSAATAPGWPEDNFIGSLPQSNAPAADWPDFWRLRRLEPQIRRARDAGRLERADVGRFDRLHNALDEIVGIARDDGMSLLHGDLWSGNVHMTGGGAALVDPSSYYGHREVDLAMSELFGGFAPEFRTDYLDAWPLQPGYAPHRRAVYQLYYLLVHVNLFGDGYRSGTLAALGAIGF